MNEEKTMTLCERLSRIQNELKAPKNQWNDYGKYNYRSCEDIMEAVKPLCAKYKTTCVITDEIVLVGDRFYIKATASLMAWEDVFDNIHAVAYARESEKGKNGMDSSQVTGATSSYARKYALNALFNIDDTKDFDTNEAHNQQNKQNGQQKQQKQTQAQKPTQATIGLVNERMTVLANMGVAVKDKSFLDYIAKQNGGKCDVSKMNEQEAQHFVKVLDAVILNKQNASNSK